MTQFKDCFRDAPVSEVISSTYVITYLIIILRDLSVLGTMMFFQFTVSRKNLYYNRILEADQQEAKAALADFEVLLVSVLPHRAFKTFLVEEHPDKLPYLQMIHLCKLYQDDHENLDAATQEHSILVSKSMENSRLMSITETSQLKIKSEIEFLNQKLKERVNNARLIAESHRQMFLPYNVNSFVRDTSEEPSSLPKDKSLIRTKVPSPSSKELQIKVSESHSKHGMNSMTFQTNDSDKKLRNESLGLPLMESHETIDVQGYGIRKVASPKGFGTE